MTRTWRPVDPDALPELIAATLASRPGVVRAAIDGPPGTQPATLAAALAAPLRRLGRPAVVIDAETFWRGASVRLECGHRDVDSYLHWLDADALRREVLIPLGPDGTGRYLPSLRDPATDRATREPPVPALADSVVIVAGTLLLGSDLPFDVSVHLALSAAGRARRTPAEWAWTLPAYEQYDASTRPVETADLVIRLDDPRHPAVAGA